MELRSEPCDDDMATSWCNLPPSVLERIYGFLNRTDRYRMSLVCSSWSKEYSSPSLWREVEFIVRKRECQSDFYPEVICARKYGRFFRRVRVTFEPLEDEHKSTVFLQLVLFLRAVVSQSQLESITFVYLGLFVPLDLRHSRYEQVLGIVVCLIERQSHLKTIEFEGDSFPMWDTMKIVEAAFGRKNWSLRNLTLKCFSECFILDCREEEEVVDSDFVSCLINLEKLEVDYSQLFEEVVFELLRSTDEDSFPNACHAVGNLRHLILHCDGKCGEYSYGRYLGITPSAWKHIRKVCPALEVHLYFSNWCNSFKTGLEFYIVRDMPLKTLNFQLIPDPIAKLSLFLRHLVATGVSERLEELSIDWFQPSPSLGCDLREFIYGFSKLKRLKLQVYHPVDDLDVVFSNWIDDRPKSLETVEITIRQIPFRAETSSNYTTLRDVYTSAMQVLGLRLVLIVEEG